MSLEDPNFPALNPHVSLGNMRKIANELERIEATLRQDLNMVDSQTRTVPQDLATIRPRAPQVKETLQQSMIQLTQANKHLDQAQKTAKDLLDIAQRLKILCSDIDPKFQVTAEGSRTLMVSPPTSPIMLRPIARRNYQALDLEESGEDSDEYIHEEQD